ncbi:MAG: hypothetical protein JOY85_03660 [Acidobacteriaceae bacterium]|nr:hypothetical protein [Acidobacteriaceae bacterium]
MKLTILPILLFAAAVAPAQESQQTPVHTNFSGRWRMDKEKSDFANFTMPDILVRVIDQHDPTMNVHTVQTNGQKTSTVDATYMTDGSVASNIINNRDATSKAFWDGKVLVIRTNMKTAKNEDEEIEDRYELSDDGQILITTSHVTTDKGEVTMKMVCVKEKSSPPA